MKMTWSDIPNITKEQAEIVRKLRCGRTMYSWRAIAEICSFFWGGDWEDNQFAGRDLCEAAAKQFGEDYNDEKWNG